MNQPFEDLYERLVSVIELALEPPGKGGRRPPWMGAVGERAIGDVAIIVIHLAVVQRYDEDDEDKAPSQQQVAKAIALALGLSELDEEEQLVRVGSGLLMLAVVAGLIEIEQAPGFKKPKRVYPTQEAQDQIEALMERIAAAKFRLPDEPLDAPSTKPIPPGRNRYGKLEPPPLPMPFVTALDHIRQTPWRINRFVFDTMSSKLKSDRQWRYLAGNRDEPFVRKKDRLRAFAMAQRLKDFAFYFDLRCDYRGRIYQHGTLRFTGAAHYIQPLLEFGRGAVLTKSGADSLAIHIGWQWGQKDFDEARKWTYANEGLLLRIARHPNKYKDWYKLKEKKRWHALAGADAWRRYREGEKVHLPLTWDAVTSGLQMYALLMRDKNLAAKVALLDGTRGSYYESIAAATGEDRDAVKAVAVPLFYGAGQSKLEVEFEEWLRENGRNVEFVENRVRKIVVAAKKEASAFTDVRKWLVKVAGVFNEKDLPIKWRTPLGYGVVQDNRWMKGPKVTFYYNKKRVRLAMQKPTSWLNKGEQATAIAANVVHSLDANVLVAVVNQGSEFALKYHRDTGKSGTIDDWGVVHDCFAVHPNNSYNLLAIASKAAIRKVFDGDWLQDLYEQFVEQAGDDIPKPPEHQQELSREFYEGKRALTP